MPHHDDEFSQYRKAGVLAGNAAVAKLEGKPDHELNLIYETAYNNAYTEAFLKEKSARGGMRKRKISKTRKMRRKCKP
jgi:hypothetical protein